MKKKVDILLEIKYLCKRLWYLSFGYNPRKIFRLNFEKSWFKPGDVLTTTCGDNFENLGKGWFRLLPINIKRRK